MIGKFRDQYSFLSNFYYCPIIIDLGWLECQYPTAEHAFQAAKATNEADHRHVLLSGTPGQAKRRGRRIKKRDNWDEVKDDVMNTVVRAKFANDTLKQQLLATDKQLLKEGNTWHDNYWGNCACQKCEDKPGENVLGKILMKIRRELKTE